MKTTACGFYTQIKDAIVFDYLLFFTSDEYDNTFSDKTSVKCKEAAQYIADDWYVFDLQDENKKNEFIELMNNFDITVSQNIVKEELCGLYVTTKRQFGYDDMYKDVVKAVKTLLKHDFHMTKEEIKALIKE